MIEKDELYRAQMRVNAPWNLNLFGISSRHVHDERRRGLLYQLSYHHLSVTNPPLTFSFSLARDAAGSCNGQRGRRKGQPTAEYT